MESCETPARSKILNIPFLNHFSQTIVLLYTRGRVLKCDIRHTVYNNKMYTSICTRNCIIINMSFIYIKQFKNK